MIKIKEKKIAFIKSKERCAKTAKQYLTLKDFCKQEIACYAAIRKNGWHELLDHLVRQCKPNGFWDKKKCREISKQYFELKKFREEQPSCYSSIMKNDWRSFLNHMQSPIKPMGFWTEQRCRKTILKFKTYKELDANFAIVLKKCREKNWCKKEIDNLVRIKGRAPFWTIDKIQQAADQCETIKEFREKFPGAYNRVIKFKFKFKRNPIKNLKRIGNLFRRAVYVYEFENKSVYIGLTCNLERRHAQHVNSKSLKKLFRKSKYKKITTGKYYSVKFAQRKEKDLIQYYKQKKWNVCNIAAAGGLGGIRIVHTREDVVLAVKRHIYFSEFRKEFPKLYSFATHNGFWSEVSKHLKRKPMRLETKIHPEEIFKEMKKYDSFSEFRDKNSRIYKAGLRRGLLNEMRVFY